MIGKYSKLIENLLEKARKIFGRYSVPRWLVFIHDSVLVFVTFLFAYLLRFNFDLTAFDFNQGIYHALLTLFVYSSFSLIFKSFSGLIRHTTIQDIFKVVSCNTCSLAVLISISLLARLYELSKSEGIIYS